MSSEPVITFYDIPSTASPPAWSPNTWKARAVLNYKRIPYRTVWVSYPDIRSTLEKIGGSPTSTDTEGNPYYTLPAILDNSSGAAVVITDSLAIAEYLETKYPDRPVFLKQGKALEYAFERAFNAIIVTPLWNLMAPLAWKILDQRSQVYYRDTRERWSGEGKTLEEWCPEGPIREQHWDALEKAWGRFAVILDKNGPNVDWVAGRNEPTRADMILVAHLAWIKAVAPDDWNKRVKYWDGGRWERLWDRSEEWRTVS